MLFKDQDTFKQFSPLTGSFNMLEIKNDMNAVEYDYLRPILGKELFNSFIAEYEEAESDEAISEPTTLGLLDKCRAVTAAFFAYRFSFTADVQVSQSGIQRNETATLKTAYQYQGTQFREEVFAAGERAIERLIAYLEDNIGDFESWKNSDDFKAYRGLFISTASEFSQYYPSHTPYRNFMAMRPKMIDVEEITIRDFLGDTIFDALKAKAILEEPNYSTKEKALLKFLKSAIAYHTVALSIPFLSVKVEANGITVSAPTNFSTNDKESIRAGADHKSIAHLIASCNDSAQTKINAAAKFITANKTYFSSWPGFIEPAAAVDNVNLNLQNTFSL